MQLTGVRAVMGIGSSVGWYSSDGKRKRASGYFVVVDVVFEV